MAYNSTTLTAPNGGKFTLSIDASASGRYVSATAKIESADGSGFQQYSCTLSVNCGTSSNSTSVSDVMLNQPKSVSAGGNGNYSTTYTCTASWSGSSGGYAPLSGSVSVNVTTGSAPVTTYSLTLNASAGGSVSGSASGITSGSVRAITGTPSDGYEFSNWVVNSGNTPLSLTDANTSVTITQNTNLTANFVESGGGRIYVNGQWRKSKVYIYINGVWKKAKPFIFKNGQWQKGK